MQLLHSLKLTLKMIDQGKSVGLPLDKAWEKNFVYLPICLNFSMPI